MFEEFDQRARKVMALANQEAERLNHEYIGAEHILLGLVKEGSGRGVSLLRNFDVDVREVSLQVEKLLNSGPKPVTMGKLPQKGRGKKVIEYATEEARNLKHYSVGTEHLLLGLLREHDGVAAQVLPNLKRRIEEVREEIRNLRPVKTIRLSAHARGYITQRGFTAAEVEEAIRTQVWQPAERGRLEVRKDFPFGATWNGRFFETKQVRPVFVDEADEIIVVTVYTYYF